MGWGGGRGEQGSCHSPNLHDPGRAINHGTQDDNHTSTSTFNALKAKVLRPKGLRGMRAVTMALRSRQPMRPERKTAPKAMGTAGAQQLVPR